jgi:hypothetical protein
MKKPTLTELSQALDVFSASFKEKFNEVWNSPDSIKTREEFEKSWQNLKETVTNLVPNTIVSDAAEIVNNPVDPTIFVKGREDNQPDWEVYYYNKEENSIQVMAVFGVPSVEEAIKEAHCSLSAMCKEWYVIVKVEQVNIDYSLLDQGCDLADLAEFLMNNPNV